MSTDIFKIPIPIAEKTEKTDRSFLQRDCNLVDLLPRYIGDLQLKSIEKQKFRHRYGKSLAEK